MKVLVTGSSGHLGEALVRTLRTLKYDIVSVDIKPSTFTSHIGSINDPGFVKECMKGVKVVYHTATLHKPHIATHQIQDFIDTNISGTLILLEQAVAAKVPAFIYTSTTSTFGDALRPGMDKPAAWITEDVAPIPKNIYGITKTAAEDLCYLFHKKQGLNCLILRTSRFFFEEDDDKLRRETFNDSNLKANELLYRRVDLEDAVSAHLLASEKATEIGFGRYIISATTPFSKEHRLDLRSNLEEVLTVLYPDYVAAFKKINWKMLQGIDRVYINDLARKDLGWKPKYCFSHVLKCIRDEHYTFSELSRIVGAKGYHSEIFSEGPYPV